MVINVTECGPATRMIAGSCSGQRCIVCSVSTFISSCCIGESHNLVKIFVYSPSACSPSASKSVPVSSSQLCLVPFAQRWGVRARHNLSTSRSIQGSPSACNLTCKLSDLASAEQQPQQLPWSECRKVWCKVCNHRPFGNSSRP